jgi:hypothetical protein
MALYNRRGFPWSRPSSGRRKNKVVLSKKRVSVFVMAMVVLAVGIGLSGVVGSASPKEDDQNNKGRTLTVMTKTREARVIDLGPQGQSQGDMRVQNAPLYDESGKEKIGRQDLFAVMTDPADEPSEKAHMVEAMYTFTLPGGEISVQGVSAYPKNISEVPPRGVNAITGGTGKYADVRGEQRFEVRGNRVIHTFRFIG